MSISLQTYSHYPAWPVPGGLRVYGSEPHLCSYLPERVTQIRGLSVESIPADAYVRFMDAGFRRSGQLIYQPVCRSCRECRPMRVLVDRFRATKSQRRCERKNQDLKVFINSPNPTDEKFELYSKYQKQWHNRDEVQNWDDYVGFLYNSPTESIEFCYRDNENKLLAVGICDVGSAFLSSVYYYFDPASAHRGLGTFGALREIAHAKSQSLRFYYLGYLIYACEAMAYKSNYRPYELLNTDGAWREPDSGADSSKDVAKPSSIVCKS